MTKTTIPVALRYLRNRFPETRVEPLANGAIFTVGASKHVVWTDVDFNSLTLFADCIQYGRNRKAQRAAEKAHKAGLERARLAARRHEDRCVANYVAEGLGEI